MFAFAGFVELPIDDWMNEPYNVKLRKVAVADVKEVAFIPEDYVYPERVAKPNDCWLITSLGKYYVALGYEEVCERLTQASRRWFLTPGVEVYVAEITNGVELGGEFLAVTENLDEAKRLVEEHNMDMGIVSCVKFGVAYHNGLPQTYWKFENDVWQLWNTNDGPIEEEEDGD